MKAFYLLVLFTALGQAATQHVRVECMCCDDNGELSEFTVLSCQEISLKDPSLKFRHRNQFDLLINVDLHSTVPINRQDQIDYDNQKVDLNKKQQLVYEARNGKTCQDFKVGDRLVMRIDKVGCVEVSDDSDMKGNEFDNVCQHGGDRLSELPNSIQQIIREQN